MASNQDLDRLEAELRQLEAEYTMFFGGRLRRPPLEARARVEAVMKRFDRTPSSNYAERFRFTSLQARFAKMTELWDRGLRARDEGRAGPFTAPAPAAEPDPAPGARNRVVAVTTVSDPARELDKVQGLFDGLVRAGQEVGQDAISFNRFADLVKAQVGAFRGKGYSEVAFRVAVKDGKVAFTARAMRKAGDGER